ncbi:hypothetical protein BCR44DRAFT_1449249 [Catenaria anguillulae PL171]|uniref:Uncharacterized protein n=1 Tax=Catenaria anguillulae PL171 TaxID=765915 RepID=A0A1Y2H6G7_9FUNG|nr:hypothetical protein BCR44DRAFT_1449249 [Catenaria anguillulae PL171]
MGRSISRKINVLNEIARTIQLRMKLGKEKDKVAMFSNQFGKSALLSLKVRLRIKHAATAAIRSGVPLGIFFKCPSTLSTNSNPIVLDKLIQAALFQHTLHPFGHPFPILNHPHRLKHLHTRLVHKPTISQNFFFPTSTLVHAGSTQCILGKCSVRGGTIKNPDADNRLTLENESRRELLAPGR